MQRNVKDEGVLFIRRILCDLGLMNLIYDDLTSLMLDGNGALKQLIFTLQKKDIRLSRTDRLRVSRVCESLEDKLSDFLMMERADFDETLSCNGGMGSELLWWCRGMQEAYDRGFPSLRLTGIEVSGIVYSERLFENLYNEYSSLALGRGQFRECTRLAIALCAGSVRLCEDPDDGITLSDIHLAARATSAWMSTERLRRAMKLTPKAVPLYVASLRLVTSWYMKAMLEKELVFYVQRHQILRFGNF